VTDAAGQPVPGAQLAVSRDFRGGFPSQDLGSVTTDAAGRFSYRLPSGPSALVRFTFAGTDVLAPSESDVRTLVKAAVRVRAKQRHKHNRAKAIFRISGVLAGTPLPSHGKTVLIQVRKGTSWRTIKHLTATPRGRYATRFTMRLARVAKRLKVRTVVPRQASYPYEKGISTAITLHIPSKP
jgi:hypothetical protein